VIDPYEEMINIAKPAIQPPQNQRPDPLEEYMRKHCSGKYRK